MYCQILSNWKSCAVESAHRTQHLLHVSTFTLYTMSSLCNWMRGDGEPVQCQILATSLFFSILALPSLHIKPHLLSGRGTPSSVESALLIIVLSYVLSGYRTFPPGNSPRTFLLYRWGVMAHWLRRLLSTEGREFDSRSSRHVGTLGKSFTCSCLCASA